jgi:hypothetical protein
LCRLYEVAVWVHVSVLVASRPWVPSLTMAGAMTRAFKLLPVAWRGTFVGTV